MAIVTEALTGRVSASSTIHGTLTGNTPISGSISKARSIVEKDYEKLENKPSINEVELIGNKNLEDLNVTEFTRLDIIRIWNEVWGDDD